MNEDKNIVHIKKSELEDLKAFQKLSDSALVLELRRVEREITRLENADCFTQWASDRDTITQLESKASLIRDFITTTRKHLIQELYV